MSQPGAEHLQIPVEIALPAAVFLVFLNGFFVNAEFALVKVRGSRVDELLKAGHRGAEAVREVISHLDAYLSATQLGITLASLGLGWLGEPAFAALIEPFFKKTGWFSSAISHSIALTFAFVIITFLHIVIGELAPKSLAIQRPELSALYTARPLILFNRVSYPIIWALNGTALGLLRALGVKPQSADELAHSEEELRFLLAESARSGVLSTGEKDLLDKVFRFGDRTARQMLIPAADVVFLALSLSIEENLKRAKSVGFTRLPLCEQGLDSVLGMIHIRDLLTREGELKVSRDLMKLRREILVVPETVSADRLLNLFRRKKVHLAIVVDEFGVTAGMISLEDVLEELVGEIQDEFDPFEEPALKRISRNEYEVDGTFLLDELKERLGVETEDPDNVTLGGHLQRILGRIAEVGDQLQVGNLQATVEEMKQHRPGRIRLRRLQPDEDEEGGGS